ncbi:NUDIX hydrolase [Ensifer sp. MJa1]|jgi:8-oxo-dGTP pyrophosphatase MutT (NUDIX family)|uniref:NUDIX hydrolase n=1 Tax=Ensifer sp. MJa1 TaxID=2919888 RepID=UPI00300A962C
MTMQITVASRPLTDARAALDVNATVVEQAGALCYRRAEDADRFDLLLISGRTSGLWGIPKGHLEIGETTDAAAAREAFEEAGVVGSASQQSIGSYTYLKNGNASIYHVRVHLVEVLAMAWDYPEKGARTIRWVPADLAVPDLARPGLQTLVADVFR